MLYNSQTKRYFAIRALNNANGIFLELITIIMAYIKKSIKNNEIDNDKNNLYRNNKIMIMSQRLMIKFINSMSNN